MESQELFLLQYALRMLMQLLVKKFKLNLDLLRKNQLKRNPPPEACAYPWKISGEWTTS